MNLGVLVDSCAQSVLIVRDNSPMSSRAIGFFMVPKYSSIYGERYHLLSFKLVKKPSYMRCAILETFVVLRTIESYYLKFIVYKLH